VNNDSPVKALLVVLAVALVCSILVSVAAVMLKPVQLRNQLVEKSRNIIGLTGLVEPGQVLSDDEILDAVEQLDIRVLDIESGQFVTDIDPADYDARAARNNPNLSIEIPVADDLARIGRREKYVVVYLVWNGDQLQRVILPVYGQGMWSTMYGYIALEADLNTVAAMTFYEQTETAGLGDQVQSRRWLANWQGRQIYGDAGDIRFRVASGPVAPDSPAAAHQVDAMTGATVTGDGVTRLIRYWFGPNGYATLINQLQARPLNRQAARSDEL
jgi:Na+-transporting NADH:ubiquinone oxidoreductase subunit C